MKPKQWFTYGNSKLPKSWAIWSLPAIKTCPGAKHAGCSKKCYARKAERMYPNVLPSREAKLALSKTPYFVHTLVKQIVSDYKKGKITHVRIHESGDFYSLGYVEKWATIMYLVARSTDNRVKFFAYTKTHHAKDKRIFNQLMEMHKAEYINFTLIQSTWEGSLDNVALGIPTCDAGTVNSLGFQTCVGNCRECTLCPDGVSVFIPMH